MLKNILNLKGAQQLSKTEQNAINGGAGGDGVCKIYVNIEGGASYWSARVYSVTEAQTYYATGGEGLFGGYGTTYTVTGYCCASCATQ